MRSAGPGIPGPDASVLHRADPRGCPSRLEATMSMEPGARQASTYGNTGVSDDLMPVWET
jgi:hypothetical protein